MSDTPRTAAAAFDITWRDGAYYVTRPGLSHETVVPASVAEKLEVENAALRADKAVLSELETGARVILPKTKEHARTMYLIAFNALREFEK